VVEVCDLMITFYLSVVISVLLCCVLLMQSDCWLLLFTSVQDYAWPAVETSSVSRKPFMLLVINCKRGLD